MIKTLSRLEIKGLNGLAPIEWQSDLEAFIIDYIDTKFFHAFVIVLDTKIVAIGNVFQSGNIAWLANIIVKKNYRNRGLGDQMTRHLVEFSRSIGCNTILLLATEMGAPVYQKVGFKKMSNYVYYESTKNTEYIVPSCIRRLHPADLEAALKLDFETNAEDRKHLIKRTFDSGFGYFDSENKLLGFYLPEFGRGLVLSRVVSAGVELLKLKHSKKGSKSMLPNENMKALLCLDQMSLKRGIGCTRMLLGPTNSWIPENIFSYGGGYCG